VKAATLYGKEDVRIEEITPRPLKSGEVRIQIEAALTCGTDLKVFKRGYHAQMIVPPAVFGHELAGIISEVCAHAHPDASFQWKQGDRVVAANSAPCGECFYCQNSRENLCDNLLFLNGAYAESIAVPARVVQKNLLHLKTETAFRDAALTEPLACVVQGIKDLDPQPGQQMLVIGTGPIGLMFIRLASHLGCVVTAAGRGVKRLEAAQRLGAKEVVVVNQSSDLVDTLPRGQRFDLVVEAVGKPETWEAAVKLVRKGGKVNFFGGCPSGTSISLDTALVHYSNLTLLASFHHTPAAIRRALDFLESGVISAGDFVDGECPLTQLPTLFRDMAKGNHAVKTLIRVKD
jgi:L-iditol 2-dehydrogenase